MINYKQILNSMFTDLAIVDKNGIMLYVTGGFEQNYNVSRDQVIGKSVDEIEKSFIFNPSVAKKVFETKEKVIMSHRNKNGNYVIVNGIPVYNENDEIEYVVSYSVDSEEIVSLQKERDNLLEKLEEYQQALSELQNQFNTMKQGMNDLQGAKNALQSINKIKRYDVSVLFTGESGVGKTTYAKYLHDNGTRAEGPFVEISCGAIPENLLESELFGYKKGSFTGANAEGKEGLIETANGGTLFLDEIAELPLKLQSKLLKVLQGKTIMHVGDTKEIKVDFRLITATNKDLAAMVAEGTFREDLFYRINVITIDIPPLRKRPEDTVSLIKYFMDKFNLKYGEKKTMSSECFQHLCAYTWPGNIREMENTLERLIIMSDEDVIITDDLPEQVFYNEQPEFGEADLADINLNELLKNYERTIIQKAARRYKSSTQLAKGLGISQTSAARKMREYIKED